MPVIVYHSQSPQPLEVVRKWSHLIKLPGVRSDLKVPVTCQLTEFRHQLVTPHRLRIYAEIELATEAVDLTQEMDEGPQIRWRVKPDSIPRASATVVISHIVNIPKDKPPILKVSDMSGRTQIENISTLRDRLVVKGVLTMTGSYIRRQTQ